MVNVKGRLIPRYVCPVCSTAFARGSAYLPHMASHPTPATVTVDPADILKAVEENYGLLREGVYSTNGLSVVHQLKLPLVDPADLDRQVNKAFSKLVRSEGYMYHVDVSFTAVVDCGKLRVCHVDKRLFTELLGGPLLLSDMSDYIRGSKYIKDVFDFVVKYCDYGALLAVPSVRFHVKSIEGVPHVRDV